MPIFEYKCTDCGHKFERIVFRNDELIKCPQCMGHDTERLISAFAMAGGSSKAEGASASCGPGKFT